MRILILTFIFLYSFVLSAQEKKGPALKKQGFEVTLSYGIIPSITDLLKHENKDPSFNPGDLSDTYHKKTISAGAINIGGNFRLRKWLDIGLTVNYSARIKFYSYKLNDAIARRDALHRISIVPEVRFLWFNDRSHMVKLYSSTGIEIGLTLNPERDSRYIMQQPRTNITLKLIPIGIKIGAKKFFGFGEAGLACTGFVALGAGYRF